MQELNKISKDDYWLIGRKIRLYLDNETEICTVIGSKFLSDYENIPYEEVYTDDLDKIDVPNPRKAVKPPLGITPKRIWQELRLQDITEAIQRYKDTNMTIPNKWIEEYNELVQILFPDFSDNEESFKKEYDCEWINEGED